MSGRQMSRDQALDLIDKHEARLGALDERFAKLAKRVTELEDENERLRKELAAVKARSDPDPTNKDYADLERAEKVHLVRVALARKAAQSNGKAKYEYRDVLSQFDQRPSAGHAYTLLEIAAQADGYQYGEQGGTKQLRVNLDAVNDEAVFHAVNNKDSRTGGSN